MADKESGTSGVVPDVEAPDIEAVVARVQQRLEAIDYLMSEIRRDLSHLVGVQADSEGEQAAASEPGEAETEEPASGGADLQPRSASQDAEAPANPEDVPEPRFTMEGGDQAYITLSDVLDNIRDSVVLFEQLGRPALASKVQEALEEDIGSLDCRALGYPSYGRLLEEGARRGLFVLARHPGGALLLVSTNGGG